MNSNFGGVPRPSALPPSAGKQSDPGADLDPAAGQQQQGDGFHHHQIDEDESGFHSTHTNPDGTIDSSDAPTYEDAKADMDAKFGCGGGDDEDMGDGDEGGTDDDMPTTGLSEAYSK